MSRTSSALLHDAVCGSLILSQTPLDVAKYGVDTQFLYRVRGTSNTFSGLFHDGTRLYVEVNGVPHNHSWALISKSDPQQGRPLSFACDCGSFATFTYDSAIVPREALMPNLQEGAQTLLKYLKNALSGDTRSININERTQSRLRLDVLLQFGWSCSGVAWIPPAHPDTALYQRAIEELEAILNPNENVRENISKLYFIFGLNSVPKSRTPSQMILGVTSDDSEATVYEQYNHQIGLDPKNTPYYFDALGQVAAYSEELQVHFMEQKSLGVVSISDIRDAYTQFGISVDDEITDDSIADIFVTNPERFAPALQKIANYRESHDLSRLAAAVYMSYDDAMRVLGVDYSSDEKLIASRAQKMSTLGPALKLEGKYALLQVASHRRSTPLLSLYENLYPSDPPVQDPYASLGVSPHMSDEDIITLYQGVSLEEPPARQFELHKNLRAVAEQRTSKLIGRFLETGNLLADPEEALQPVGLWNIGNTCYLNSLLQFYNTLIPFRDALESLDAQGEDESLSKKKIGGRLVPYPEVARSQKFLGSLNSLFKEMATTKDRFVTPSEELAYMALVPPREDVEEEQRLAEEKKQKKMLSEPTPEASVPPTSEHAELVPEGSDEPGVAADSTMGLATPETEPVVVDQPPALPARDAEAEYRIKLHQAIERQQDVTECIENVLYQVEAGVKAKGYDKDGEQQDLVKDLFFGEIVQTLKNEDGSDTRVKHERISCIMVNVADGPQDIYTALDAYFGAETMELSEGNFERTVALSKTPPVLQIQIQRVQFDRKTFQLFKNNSPLILENIIYMDRYMETKDPVILKKRVERARLQERKQELEKQLTVLQTPQKTNLTHEDNLNKCVEWLESYIEQKESDEMRETLEEIRSTAQTLRQEAEEIENELKEIEQTLDSQFRDYRQHEYHLHSLFIHRGQASHGHYWIYIKDFEKDQYLKYNDETVTPVSPADVFDYSPGNTSTPYFLVYIRKDFIDKVQSVNRVIKSEANSPRATSITELSGSETTTEVAPPAAPAINHTHLDTGATQAVEPEGHHSTNPFNDSAAADFIGGSP